MPLLALFADKQENVGATINAYLGPVATHVLGQSCKELRTWERTITEQRKANLLLWTYVSIDPARPEESMALLNKLLGAMSHQEKTVALEAVRSSFN